MEEKTLGPDDIDGAYVARPAPGLIEVPVGADLVIADGSRVHTLNQTAALVWESLDGISDLDGVATELSVVTGADRARVSNDVVAMARELGRMGLLEGVVPPPAERDSGWVPPEPVPVGQRLEDLPADVDGADLPLDRRLLLVNWSPGCGFCVQIGPELAALQHDLEAHGVGLVFLTVGDPGHNQKVFADAGLSAPALFKEEGADPFEGFGTPAAYLLDPDGTVAAPLAYGAVEVPLLARDLAGLGTPSEPAAGHAGVRYLPAAAACGPGSGGGKATDWGGTRVYAFDEYHVGIRFNDEMTARVLDRLFPGARVDDPRAPANYSLVLVPAAGGAVRELNLLVADGQQVVRSRSAARVLRGLLTHLSAQLVPPDLSLLRLLATPALREGQGLLLPPDLTPWLKELQPRLGRLGIQLADMPWALVDPDSAELVVPGLSVAHDPRVVEEAEGGARLGSELPAVAAGRYRLGSWYPIGAENRVGPLSHVEAVAFALPLLLASGVSGSVGAGSAWTDTDRLVGLLERVPAHALWFWTAQELAAQLAEILPVTPRGQA